ncbi:hypothetical protein [Paenibacillus marinisediminis]
MAQIRSPESASKLWRWAHRACAGRSGLYGRYLREKGVNRGLSGPWIRYLLLKQPK